MCAVCVPGRYLLKVVTLSKGQLTHLDVSGCFQVDHSILQEVFRDCPALTHLNLRSCRKLGQKFIEVITSMAVPPLRSLNLGGNYNIDDQAMQCFLRGYPKLRLLQELNISGISIKDSTLLLLINQCPALRSLGLGYLDVNEQTLREVFLRLGGQVERLDLSWLSTTIPSYNLPPSPEFLVDSLVLYCTRLKEVDLSGNRVIFAPHLVDLIERKLAQVTFPPPVVQPS